MPAAEPIRDRAHVEEIKRQLRDQGRLRDYAIFACGMNWALRVSDLLRLRVGDVQNGIGLRDFFTMQQKKTRKAVRVDITNSCREALILYLGERPQRGGHPAGGEPSAPLFPSRERQFGQLASLTRQQVHRIVRDACAAAGLTDGTWSTHTLRKTWGYHAYREGAPLAVVQRKLGHRHPSVTLDYLGLTDDDVTRWSEKIDL